MRIAVVGNCQARPLGTILSLLVPRIETLDPVIVHLARADEEEEVSSRLEEADIVFAQLVADDYPTSFVRLNALRERHGDKVVPWVNLYWRGRNPEVVYRRELMGKDIAFPLQDYHLEPIHDGWREGMSADAIAALLADPERMSERYGAVATASLDALRARDTCTDVRIADFVEERAGTSDLFHTFNHPTTELLVEYSRRLLSAIGLRVDRFLPAAGWEPLGPLVLPPSPASARPAWPERTYCVPDRPRPYRLMDEREVVETFLKGYDEAQARAQEPQARKAA